MTRALISFLALALAATSCAPASGPPAAPASTSARYFGNVTPPAGNVLRFNLGAEPEIYDPGLAVGQPDGRVCRIMFEGLTREDPKTLEPRPGQAYRWDISEDGLRYTFHLRPGIRWSDGTPVTSRDFRWSWLRVLRPETAARYSGLLASIANAEAFTKGEIKDENQVGIAAPDDSTLEVRLAQPTAYFLYLVDFYTCLPVPRWTFEKYGNRWTLPGNIVTGITYIHRRRQGEIGARNVAVPTSSYIPLQVTEVASGRQVTVYNQDPALRGRFDVLWDNYREMDTEFNGVDITSVLPQTANCGAGWIRARLKIDSVSKPRSAPSPD